MSDASRRETERMSESEMGAEVERGREKTEERERDSEGEGKICWRIMMQSQRTVQK